jgi:hypothetical protein
MDTCTIETGLLRKKPCGHAAVSRCLNCEQPLCVQHAVPQLSESGAKTGKFMCQECTNAAKQHAKTMAGVARAQEAKKMAGLAAEAKSAMAQGTSSTPAKPAAQAHAKPAAAPAAPEPAKAPEAPSVLEFTPSKKP